MGGGRHEPIQTPYNGSGRSNHDGGKRHHGHGRDQGSENLRHWRQSGRSVLVQGQEGADDAGQLVSAQGGSVTWLGPQNYDNLGPDAADLIRTALSQNPSAIVGPDWVPEAMDEAFKAVADAKVPLIIYNAGGMDAAKKLSAMNYIGSDEYVAGVAGGQYFGKNGSKNVLCINTLPGAANTESRCKGVAEGLTKNAGKANQLPLPSTSFGNPTAVAEAIKAALLKDPSVDGVITISAGDANSAANAIMQAGAVEKVKLGTFDMDDLRSSGSRTARSSLQSISSPICRVTWPSRC